MPHRRLVSMAVAGVLVSALLSGCALLSPGSYNSYFGGDTGPDEMVSTEYQRGSATLKLSGGVTEDLDLALAPGSGIASYMGTDVVFRDADGWALQLQGFGVEAAPFGGYGLVSIHRAIRGHWVAQDSQGACTVKVAHIDASGFRGTASCTALRWTDALAPMMQQGRYIEGERPFDAEITFEALP